MSGAGKGDRRGSRRRTVEGDEARLWQEVMRDVRPLSGRRISIPEERPSAPRPGPETPARPAQAVSAPRPAGELPELGPGVAPGVDKRTLRRLHRGQLEIEARIDLHGLTQEEAGAPRLPRRRAQGGSALGPGRHRQGGDPRQGARRAARRRAALAQPTREQGPGACVLPGPAEGRRRGRALCAAEAAAVRARRPRAVRSIQGLPMVPPPIHGARSIAGRMARVEPVGRPGPVMRGTPS